MKVGLAILRSILNLDTFYAFLVPGSHFFLASLERGFQGYWVFLEDDFRWFCVIMFALFELECMEALKSGIFLREPLVFSDICSVSLWKIRFSWETAS